MFHIYYGLAWEKKFQCGKKARNEKTFENSDFSKNREVKKIQFKPPKAKLVIDSKRIA